MANVNVPPLNEAPVTVVGSTPQSVFPFDFPFWQAADLQVSIDGELLNAADFTVEGLYVQNGSAVEGGYGSGVVTLNTAVSNVSVMIDRFVEASRESQFSRAAPLGMPSLNSDLNKLTARQQDVARLARRIQFEGLTQGLDAAGSREAIQALGRLENLADIDDAADARQNLNLGDRACVLDFISDSATRAAIMSGTLTTDVSDAIEAAFASLPASGGVLYMPGHYRSTRTVDLGGKALTILGDGRQGSSWTAAHSGDLFECIQTEVTQRVEFRGIQPRSVSATGSRAVGVVTWPEVASYGYCNFVTDDVEVQGNAAYSATNANSFQFAFDLHGAWQPTILRTTYFGAAPQSITTGPRTDSAFLRVGKCFGLNVTRDCIVLYAGAGILQVDYCEGIYDLGQYIGCGYGIRTDPTCPVGGNGFKGILITPSGEYNCFSGGVLLDTINQINVSDSANFSRWGTKAADWVAIDLVDCLGGVVPPIDLNCPPVSGYDSWGVRVRVVSAYGAGIAVEGTRIANAVHAVDFGAMTTRCSVGPTTTSTGASGPNNFVDNGTGNLVSWRGAGTWVLSWLKNSTSYANDATAAAAGIPVGGLYRNGSVVQIRIT